MPGGDHNPPCQDNHTRLQRVRRTSAFLPACLEENMNLRSHRARLNLFNAGLLVFLLGVHPAAAAPQPVTPYNIQHVFLIVMENRGYSKVWNTSATPYTTALAKRYARAAGYHALTHPSLPNYLMMVAGSNYGIKRDCSPSSTCRIKAAHLGDILGARNISWKGYMESMPSPCTLKDSGRYAARHNPFIYFDDMRLNPKRCRQRIVPLTALSSDLSSALTTPRFAMIIPNECNDTHDCSIATGDRWLKAHVPPILKSPACTKQRCLVILTWDEDNGHEKNHVLTVFAGSAARLGAVSTLWYNHYSLLRTIENIFGVPAQTRNDAAARAMNDMLR